MSNSRVSRGSLLGATAAFLASLLTIPLASPASAVPAYTMQERAQAIAEPALLFTELISKGVVREKSSGKVLSDQELVVSIRCTAVVINPSGAALTTKFCVAPTRDRVSKWAYALLADQLTAAGKLTAAGRQAYLSQLVKNAEFVTSTGEEPTRQVFAQAGDAAVGTTNAPAISASVPQASNTSDVGLTVLQLERRDLPALEIGAATGLNSGAGAVALGYAQSGKAYSLKATSVGITGVEGEYQPPWYKVDGKLSLESRGGGLIDDSGRLMGLLLWNTSANDTLAVTAALSEAGVTNEISDTDRLYRQAVDDYFAGRYKDAIKKFDQVKSVQPTNAGVTKYQALAASRLAVEGGGTASEASIPTWAIIAASAVGGAILVALLVLIMRLARPRRRQQPEEQLIPISVNPFAPISGGGYPTSGGGYPQFPTDGYPTLPPQPGAVQPPPTILAIPESAAPGLPIPQPPVRRPTQADAPAQIPPQGPPIPQGPPAMPQGPPMPQAQHSPQQVPYPPHQVPYAPQQAPQPPGQVQQPGPLAPQAPPPAHPAPTAPQQSPQVNGTSTAPSSPAPAGNGSNGASPAPPPDFTWPEDDESGSQQPPDSPWAPPSRP